jgi:hypothetical protein
MWNPPSAWSRTVASRRFNPTHQGLFRECPRQFAPVLRLYLAKGALQAC